jgi:hypothetical protein
MQSPTQSSEPSSPNTLQQQPNLAGGGRGAAAGARAPPDVVGVDAIKVFIEDLRPALKSSCEDAELDGVSTFLPSVIQKFVERVLNQFNAKKLCVVFDGLFLTMSLKENKDLTEDIVMAMAVIFLKLEQEVMFAPYLAGSQLEALRGEGHIQAVYKAQPMRIPSEFVSWNESDAGPRQPNIYKHILNLVTYTEPNYPVAVYLLHLDRSNSPAAADSATKFLEKFSSVDEPYNPSPPVLFLLQSAGVVSPRLSRALANRVVESDGVERDETQKALHEFMSVLLPLRAQIVHQLITHIPTSPPENEIHFRWDENNNNASPPIIALDNWAISPMIQGRNGPQSKDHLHYVEPWGITDVLKFEHCAISTHKYEEVTIQTLVPTVILRSLDLMGYFTHAQDEEPTNGSQTEQTGESNCSIFGEALKQFQDTPELSEAAVLFIELVRTNAFTIFRNLYVSEQIVDRNPNDVPENEKNELSAKDIAAKIATLIPCAALLDPKKTAEKYNVASQAQFIRAAQAHARSLRMLLEASAGNVILREFVNLAVYNPPNYVPHPYSLAGATDVIPTVAAALPFGANPPSARSYFMFCALREFGTAEAIAAEFGTPVHVVESDIKNMRNFVQGLLNARNHLSVRDEDVGLDPAMLEVTEPAIKELCDVVGVEYMPPVIQTEDSTSYALDQEQ